MKVGRKGVMLLAGLTAMLVAGALATWGHLPLAGLDALVYGITGVTLGAMGANVGEHYMGRPKVE